LQNRILPLAALASLLFIIGVGCTKLDTTTLGTDVLTVDNVNTFSETFPVITQQGIFTNDSTLVRKNENHVLGLVTFDPLFGKTEAAIYVQFKPPFYPFYFGNSGDTVRSSVTQPIPLAGFDSAYICLSYKGAWGDTAAANPLKLQITKITDPNFKSNTDAILKLNNTISTDGISLGEVTVTPQIIKDKSVFGRGKDSVVNTIKIPFNTAAGVIFAKSLFNQDTTGFNNGFKSDSLFREKSFGFEIKVNSALGKTLYYVNLTEATSRLEFVFGKRNFGKLDTIVQSFRMYPVAAGATVAASSSHNYLVRDRTGSAVTVPSTDNIYLQTGPGTFGNLSIPGLTGLSNRIIHRAYLVVDQTGITATQSVYTPPPYLYLDLKDTVVSNPQIYKPLYFDLSLDPYNPDANFVNPLYHPYPNANVDTRIFGGQALQRYDAAGNLFYRYEINITRYVQHIVTNGYKNYDLRLYAPFNYFYPQYLGTQYLIPFFNPLAAGSIKVGSGNTTDIPHRMKLVVIYSKL
jgi:Domain of unknown function (DUF4270)